MDDREQTELDVVATEISDDVEIRLEYEASYDWIAFCPRRNDDAGALTRYFGKQAGEPVDEASSSSANRGSRSCSSLTTWAWSRRSRIA